MAGRVWCPVRTCGAARRATLSHPSAPTRFLHPLNHRPSTQHPSTPSPTHTHHPTHPPQAGDAYLKVGRARSYPEPNTHGSATRAAAAASPLASPRLTDQRGAGGAPPPLSPLPSCHATRPPTARPRSAPSEAAAPSLRRLPPFPPSPFTAAAAAAAAAAPSNPSSHLPSPRLAPLQHAPSSASLLSSSCPRRAFSAASAAAAATAAAAAAASAAPSTASASSSSPAAPAAPAAGPLSPILSSLSPVQLRSQTLEALYNFVPEEADELGLSAGKTVAQNLASPQPQPNPSPNPTPT